MIHTIERNFNICILVKVLHQPFNTSDEAGGTARENSQSGWRSYRVSGFMHLFAKRKRKRLTISIISGALRSQVEEESNEFQDSNDK